MRTRYYVLFLLFLSFVSHLAWFVPNTIFSFGDWYYWPLEALKQLYYSWGTWVTFFGLGSTNIQITFNLFMFPWSLLANIGFGYDIVSKLTFFIPIAILQFLAPYILAKKLIKDNFISCIVAIFYGTTTVALVNQLPIQFVYTLTPLIIYTFILALEKNSTIQWIIFLICYFIGIGYEVRIMYIVTFILLFYFLFLYGLKLKKYILPLVISFAIIVGLNLFWLLPTAVTGISESITTVTSRILFGDNLFDIVHAFTIFNWLWTGGKPNNAFDIQPVILYFWIFPLLAFSSFLFFKTNNETGKKRMLYFGFISLIGILLTKQSAIPFNNLYQFLYTHFPGFSLFRESSKLFSFTAIGYFGLLSYLLFSLRNSKFKNQTILFYVVSASMVIVSLLNLRPLMTGEIGSLYVQRTIPTDYVTITGYFDQRSDFYRTFWVPSYSRWSLYDDNHPEISAANQIDSQWKPYIDYASAGSKYTEGELILKLLHKPFANELLNASSIKYVVVPLQDKANDDDFFVYYGKPRQYYINQLDMLPYLKKIDIGTKDIVVYENEGFRDHVYLTNGPLIFDKGASESATQRTTNSNQKTEYQFINPTEYKVTVSNLKNPTYLQFAESFHPDWKLRVGEFHWWDVLMQKNYFLPDSIHSKNDALLNQYKIDPTIVCKVHNVCKVNKDGSYDIEMTLFFAPQSYMYLGLIISMATGVGIVGYLSYKFIKFVRFVKPMGKLKGKSKMK